MDDASWTALTSGYGNRYDVRSALRQLKSDWNSEGAWKELWDELHHQGDLGTAAYAAIPALVQLAPDDLPTNWNLYGLAVTVETERHRTSNPSIPAWLAGAYAEAWSKLHERALVELRNAADSTVIRLALAIVALARGETLLGSLIGSLDESEIEELAEDRLAWSELYEPRGSPLPRA